MKAILLVINREYRKEILYLSNVPSMMDDE